jgi:hypothetical protein
MMSPLLQVAVANRPVIPETKARGGQALAATLDSWGMFWAEREKPAGRQPGFEPLAVARQTTFRGPPSPSGAASATEKAILSAMTKAWLPVAQ